MRGKFLLPGIESNGLAEFHSASSAAAVADVCVVLHLTKRSVVVAANFLFVMVESNLLLSRETVLVDITTPPLLQFSLDRNCIIYVIIILLRPRD